MEPILKIENLTHTYSVGTPFERDAVKDISFSVNKGEFLGIIGHTGSGKSTLIQHFNGLLRPTAGRVLLDGKDTHGMNAIQVNKGYLGGAKEDSGCTIPCGFSVPVSGISAV